MYWRGQVSPIMSLWSCGTCGEGPGDWERAARWPTGGDRLDAFQFLNDRGRPSDAEVRPLVVK
jgi:hypothetical protein